VNLENLPGTVSVSVLSAMEAPASKPEAKKIEDFILMMNRRFAVM
jgi:hypothetical protein